MFSQKSKHTIAQIFLFAFILIKASGLHAFAHHDSDKASHCVLCQLSSRDNLTPAIKLDNTVNFEIFEKHIYVKIINHYINLASEKPAIFELFSRPPPFFTV